MLKIALATLRHRLMGFVGAFLALALGTTMIGMMTLTLAATFGTPHPGPQRFKEARTVIAPQGFEGRPMKAPAVLPADVVADVTAAGTATPDRSFPVRLDPGPAATGHPWSSAAFAGYRLTAGHAPRAADEIVLAGDPSLIGRQTRATAPENTGQYKIVGVTDAPWFENPAFFSDTEAQRLSPGVNALVTDQRAAQLSTLLTGRATVVTGDDLIRLDTDTTGGAQALANAQAMAGSTTGLAVSVAVFVVIATFAFATEQRRRELALMRLIGAAPRQVRRMVLGEALLIGLAAATAGCLLAPLCTMPLRAWMLDHNVAPTWFTIPLNPLPLLISFLIGVIAALTGSAATLVRVSLVKPIEVLRENAVERRVMTPLRWLLGTAMLIGAVTAGIVISRTEPYLAASVRKYEAVPVLYVGAVTLLAPILLRPVTRLLLAPLRRSTKAGPVLVRENILTSRRRTAATVAPVVVAVGLVATLLTMQKTGDAAQLTRQQQEIHATAVVVPTGPGITTTTLDRLTAVPGIRVTPTTSMNIRIGTPDGDQIDSLSANAVPAAALGTTITPPLVSGSLTDLPDNFLIIDEHAAQSNSLTTGDHVVTLLPNGTRVTCVIAAVIARGLAGDDTYLSATLTTTTTPTRLYLDSRTGTGQPLDPPQTTAVDQALTDTGAHLVDYDTYLETQRAHAAEQSDNAAVVILGIALAYALIAVANTLIMAMAGRRREFALLGLVGTARTQIIKITTAESAIAVTVGTLLAAIATALAATTQHLSLTKLITHPSTVVPWTRITETIALCALVTLATTTQATARATRQRAIEAAGNRE
ncbi:FtsX-like permease family protein [Kitasatospora sp. NPDC003701]